jgi:hypothetical protein
MGPHAPQGVSAEALKGLKVVTPLFWGRELCNVPDYHLSGSAPSGSISP